MTSISETVAASCLVLKYAYLVLENLLAPTAFHYPGAVTLTNNSNFTHIVVGGGTAGCALAYRLAENPNYTVALIESGGNPPYQGELTGLFTTITESPYDYNYTTVNNNFTGQNLQNGVIGLTQGNMLGGSGNIDHSIWVWPTRYDLDTIWTNIIGDSSWSFDNVLPYLKKQENMVGSLLTSISASLHGTTGPKKITQQPSSSTDALLKLIKEAGFSVLNDTTSDDLSNIGWSVPLLNIADGTRQSSSFSYLNKALNFSNLYIAKYTTANKILIENNVATGVEVTTSSGDTYVLNAKKEVVITAGAIGSPILLMNSGIGPKELLTSLNISVVLDLPVGQSIIDHPSVIIVLQSSKSTSASPQDWSLFPVPCITGNVALNSTVSTYQAIMLEFPPSSTAAVQLCYNSFKYTSDICDKWYAAGVSYDTVYVVVNILQPTSRGSMNITSTDPGSKPIVDLKLLSNSSDLDMMSKSICHFLNDILNSTSFQNENYSYVSPGVCQDYTVGTYKFCECYAIAMSANMWHTCGGCAMGSVLDSDMCVKGIPNLRVADSSAMPALTSGNIHTTVNMMAEYAADLIKYADA